LIIAYDHRRMVRAVLKPSHGVVGRRLREARIASQLTQDALGVAIGLDEGTACIRISRYESGVHSPSLDVLPRLASVLGVPVAFLVTEDDLFAKRLLAMSLASPAQLAAVDGLLFGQIDG
jgi:transcriptional regulator with XRE-family HTH domain